MSPVEGQDQARQRGELGLVRLLLERPALLDRSLEDVGEVARQRLHEPARDAVVQA